MTASMGLGYGLGQYTVTGMDPFLSLARSSSYNPDRPLARQAQAQLASASTDFDALFEPGKPTY